jgi:ATP-binding cassette subfamily F protein 3
MMSYNAPHIMLLDEPTNHLDIDARAALIQALNGYEGCVILVSHDPHLVEAVADQLWLVKDGKVQNFTGDLESYKQLIIDQRRKERSADRAENREKKNNNKKAKEKKDNSIKKVEQEIEKWSSEKQRLEKEMATTQALNKPSYMNELTEKYKIAQSQIDSYEAKYLELYEEIAAE